MLFESTVLLALFANYANAQEWGNFSGEVDTVKYVSANLYELTSDISVHLANGWSFVDIVGRTDGQISNKSIVYNSADSTYYGKIAYTNPSTSDTESEVCFPSVPIRISLNSEQDGSTSGRLVNGNFYIGCIDKSRISNFPASGTDSVSSPADSAAADESTAGSQGVVSGETDATEATATADASPATAAVQATATSGVGIDGADGLGINGDSTGSAVIAGTSDVTVNGTVPTIGSVNSGAVGAVGTVDSESIVSAVSSAISASGSVNAVETGEGTVPLVTSADDSAIVNPVPTADSSIIAGGAEDISSPGLVDASTGIADATAGNAGVVEGTGDAIVGTAEPTGIVSESTLVTSSAVGTGIADENGLSPVVAVSSGVSQYPGNSSNSSYPGAILPTNLTQVNGANMATLSTITLGAMVVALAMIV